MKGISLFHIFLSLFLFLLSFHCKDEAEAAANDGGVYIVYMGAPAAKKGTLRVDQLRLINYLSR